MKKTGLALLAALGLTMGACVPSNNPAGSGSTADLNALYQKVDQHDQQLKALSAGGAAGGSGNLSSQADMWAQMQSMRQDLDTIKGQLAGGAGGGNLDARVAQLEAAMRQMSADLGMKVPPLDSSSAGYTPTPAPVQPGTAEASTSGASGGESDRIAALYDSGTRAFGSRRYSEGVKIFDEFVKAYPNNSLTSNAYFWQGECYYALKDYSRAALAYNNVLENFPGSSKYQSAMLKQGMALYAAGRKDAGKVRLNELVTAYPKSMEAGQAKKFLQSNP